MAYIPVPTGMRTITYTSSRSSFIHYRCASCGQECLYEHRVQQTGQGSYSVLQRQKTKQKISDAAKEASTENLNAADDALFRAFNADRNYVGFHTPVKCPHCGAVQPWSNVPVSFWKSQWPLPWGMLSFFLFFGSAATGGPALTLLALVLIILPPAISSSRVKKAKKALEEASFQPPVYYNRSNIQELINSPACELLRPYLQKNQA